MPNLAMEFHDSTFAGVEQNGSDLMLLFSAAYIHKSEGEPGVDAGSGWAQEVHFHISHASVSGEILDLPCDLQDGFICVGDKVFRDLIPVPIQYEGRIDVELEEGGKFRITGTSLRVELCGEPKYVEEFPGR